MQWEGNIGASIKQVFADSAVLSYLLCMLQTIVAPIMFGNANSCQHPENVIRYGCAHELMTLLIFRKKHVVFLLSQ